MIAEGKKSTGLNNSLANVIELRPAHLSNEAIVSGLVTGDVRSAEALVDRFGAAIERRVWRLLGADSEHCDVVQQVYTQILQSIGSLRDAAALADWIMMVTVNVVRNELRGRKYRRLIKMDETPGLALLDPSDTTERVQLLRGYKILETMKVEHRIVFIMRYIEGTELTDIARAAGCSLATVKRRIKVARDVFMRRAKRDLVLCSLVTRGDGDV